MCNCNKNEFELLPEFEVMSNEGQYETSIRNRSTATRHGNASLVVPSSWAGLPEVLNTEILNAEQFEYGTIGKCERQPGGIQGGKRELVRNTSVEPFKYICKIEMGGGHCTGTLIAPNKVLTSAHCLYDRGTSRYDSGTIRIIPGKNGAGSSRATEPFGSTTAIRLNVPDGYRTALDYNSATPFDYGIITLRDRIGSRMGYWRRLAYKPDDLLLKHKVNTAGYAGDIDRNRQVSAYDQNVAVDTHTIEFKLDVCGGQSGSPIWVRWRQFRAIVGIVKRVDALDTAGNVGVRMTPSVLADIQKWVKS